MTLAAIDALLLVGPGGRASWASAETEALLGPAGDVALPVEGAGEVEVAGLRVHAEPLAADGARLVALTVVGAAGVRARVAALENAARVVSRVGHQIRSPLAGVVAGVELLRACSRPGGGRDAGLDGEAGEVVAQLAAGLGRVQLAARDADLRVAARLLHPTPCRLADAVAAAFAAVEPLAAASEVALVAVAGELTVTADAQALARALGELARNAVEASPLGGRVVAGLERRGRAAVVTLGDTGPGVDATIRGHVGEPWLTTRPGRIGLGLSVAAEIAELHGGSVRLAAGEPTVFELHLPVDGAAPAPACAACPPGRAAAICWAIVGEEARRTTGVWPLACRRCPRFQARVLSA